MRRMARAQGFLDPVSLLAGLQRFSQPSEVMAPTELLRAGAILQARGLVNSQAIQHNLDWLWPYWVQKQFDPADEAFIPRAFNVSHINLTHRNWTAVGLPDCTDMPIVDPSGLTTPFFDGWSIDCWVLAKDFSPLVLPSRAKFKQRLDWLDGFSVITEAENSGATLLLKTKVWVENKRPVCVIEASAKAPEGAWLAFSLRPYNPEGVSFIHDVTETDDRRGWKVNDKQFIYFDHIPERHSFSTYKEGDVFRNLDHAVEGEKCDVGLATAAALYTAKKSVRVEIPLSGARDRRPDRVEMHTGRLGWEKSLESGCRLKIPDEKFQFLYDAAVRTLILHSPGDVYPGPYTYKRFWFRDAAFILNAMLCTGLAHRARRVIDRFSSRQTPFGYFLSQEGEWDSNGEALWAMRRYCEITGESPLPWKASILKAGKWIQRKRLQGRLKARHAGLLPSGFSAEHLGPNDFYYWDNFWGVGGLEAAAVLAEVCGEGEVAAEFFRHAEGFRRVIEQSLKKEEDRLKTKAMPASPYRRLDAGSIGSLAGGYPLQIWPSNDERLLETAEFLMKNYFVRGGFFQEISHSGINPYLTLYIAQVLLRAGDMRFHAILKAIAALASPTGQWPEAVHPRTLGGCMGDGQHVWAAAEWVMMIRNAFVREEKGGKLILFSGIAKEWRITGQTLEFGPAPTSYGPIELFAECGERSVKLRWNATWRSRSPMIEIRLPGHEPVVAPEGCTEIICPI